MKRMTIDVLLFSCVLLGLCACQTVDEQYELPPTAVIFDRFYINHAWGFGCSGCYIDVSGAVHHYDCRGLRDSLVSPEWQGREEELLQHRFSMQDSILCQVDANQLVAMRALINVASRIPPFEPEQTMADAGATSFTAYVYDPKTGVRQDFLLATLGDWSRRPSSNAADQIVKWLEIVCPCEGTNSTQ